MFGGFLCIHSRIHEADQVREVVITEDHMHPCLALLVAVDVVQPLWPFALKSLTVVAAKVEIDRTPQDALVGCHPLNALPACQSQRFLRDTSLRRPQSFG